MERQAQVEVDAQRLVKAGQEPEAVKILQQLVNENCGRVEKEYRTLNAVLPAMLETTGIDYLFTDCLKEWASKEDVPLPIQ